MSEDTMSDDPIVKAALKLQSAIEYVQSPKLDSLMSEIMKILDDAKAKQGITTSKKIDD
jgi:hypothetical protein